jgi:hypothetical protein
MCFLPELRGANVLTFLRDPIFKFEFVCVCGEPEACAAELIDAGYDGSLATSLTHSNIQMADAQVSAANPHVWFRQRPTPGVAAHEAYHLARRALSLRGVDESAEETYAYYIDWLVTGFMAL